MVKGFTLAMYVFTAESLYSGQVWGFKIVLINEVSLVEMLGGRNTPSMLQYFSIRSSMTAWL